MLGFRFDTPDALLAALSADLVPRRVASAPVRAVGRWDAPPGATWIAPASGKVSDAMRRRLERAGAPFDAVDDDGAREVSCWAELLPPLETPIDGAADGRVLFLLPSQQPMIEVAGELIRLGCSRQSYTLLPDGGSALLAVAPPWFTVLRALDRDRDLRAFVPVAGREDLWIELGWDHPGARAVHPSRALLLVPGRGEPWMRLGRPAWRPIDGIVDLELRPPAAAGTPTRPTGRVRVELRLVPGRQTSAAELWVLRDQAIRQVESIVSSLPERTISGLLYAVVERTAGDGGPLVVLRTRPGYGDEAPPLLDLDGAAYAAREHLENLYVPIDRRLEPPLLRDRLRALLAPDPDRLTWLRLIDDDGRFQAETLADDAFEPLDRWVEYIVDSGAARLDPWIRSTLFDLEPYVLDEAEPEPTGVGDRRPRAPSEGGPAADGEHEDPTVAESSEAPRSRARPRRAARRRAARATRPARRQGEAEDAVPRSLLRELEAAEEAFLAQDLPGDDPRRIEEWRTLATLSTALGRRAEAGLYWPRVLWEPGREALFEDWLAAERALAGEGGGDPVEHALRGDRPDREDTRLVAAAIAAAAERPTAPRDEEVQRWTLWLERHEANLDIRSAWLARCALARLVGGDVLALARSRDRLLAALRRGLPADREVPAFLRRADGALRAAGVDRAAEALEGLLERFERAKRARSAIEAPPARTFGVARLIVATALARLGRADDARALARDAERVLDGDDPIHGFLLRAYGARIEQGLDGRGREEPLPAEIAAELNRLDRFSRYKVDRLRQASELLEPRERLDPMSAFHRGEVDPRGPELEGLRGSDDPEEIAATVAAVRARATVSRDLEERARLLDGAMDFFPLLAESQALPLLAGIADSAARIPPARRVELLEKALALAGHFGQDRLTRSLAETLGALLRELGPDHAARAATALEGMLGTLRRFGLTGEARGLLEALETSATGDGTEAVLLRLRLGAAQALLGRPEAAGDSQDEAFELLGRDEMTPAERLALCRALARALSVMPDDRAVAGLERLEREELPATTDAFNTNSHFCLSVLHLLESLVLGYLRDDLSVGPKLRRWLDDEEHLIRRRIHRDMAAARRE